MGHAENKRARQEQIIQLLLMTRSGISAAEIAEETGAHHSTIYRDLKEIDRHHHLIQTDRGGYRLNPAEYISNVRLHPIEALSIYLALRRYIRQTTRAPEFMINALQKVGMTLANATLIDYLTQSNAALRNERMASPQRTVVWRTVLDGWLGNTVVRIDYLKPNADDVQRHEIEPILFEPAILGHGTYLIAWSRTRDAMRVFKLNRIKRARPTTIHFPPRAVDLEALLEHAWGIWYGEKTVKIELLFASSVAGRVQETLRHPSERSEVRADGRLYWTVEVATYQELLPWLYGWGPLVEVLAPEALRRKIAGDMRAAAALYEEE